MRRLFVLPVMLALSASSAAGEEEPKIIGPPGPSYLDQRRFSWWYGYIEAAPKGMGSGMGSSMGSGMLASSKPEEKPKEEPKDTPKQAAVKAVSRWLQGKKFFPTPSAVRSRARAEARKLNLAGDESREFVTAFYEETRRVCQRVAAGYSTSPSPFDGGGN